MVFGGALTTPTLAGLLSQCVSNAGRVLTGVVYRTCGERES
jgi:hypothetical protein